MANVSMNCPEVNGAVAALEDNVEEGIMTQEEAEAAFDVWVQEHLSVPCYVCSKEES